MGIKPFTPAKIDSVWDFEAIGRILVVVRYLATRCEVRAVSNNFWEEELWTDV